MSLLVFEQQDPIVGGLVVAPVPDEVEHVVLGLAQLSLQGPQVGLRDPVDLDRARVLERAEGSLQLPALLLDIDPFGVARGADHAEDPQRQVDLQRPSWLRQIEIADDRRPSRDGQEARLVVEILPRHFEELWHPGKRHGNPEPSSVASGGRERGAVQLSDVALEHRIEQLGAETLRQLHLGRVDPTPTTPR